MTIHIDDDYLVCVINRRFPFVNVAEVTFEGIWLENGYTSFYEHFISHHCIATNIWQKVSFNQYLDIGHHIREKKKHIDARAG